MRIWGICTGLEWDACRRIRCDRHSQETRIKVKQPLDCADADVIAYPHTLTPLPRHEDIRMDAQEPVSTSATAPKGKPARKGKPKPAVDSKGKRSLNLSISVDTYERLMIHAMRMTSGNISELVEKLAADHLREFHLTRTATRSGETDAA